MIKPAGTNISIILSAGYVLAGVTLIVTSVD